VSWHSQNVGVTVELVALCRRRPELPELLAALRAAGPRLRVRPHPSGAALQLLDELDRLLLDLDRPLLIRTPGEIRRLLDVEAVREPVWWVEVRAVGARPEAAAVARRVGTALVAQLDGVVWPEPPG
jgi:hypothetical protein